MELYDFQKETVKELLGKKRIAVVMTGGGKTAIAMSWLKQKCNYTGKRRVLIVTTATKAKSGDMEEEAKLWNGADWISTLISFEVVSWHKLKKWVEAHDKTLGNYVVVADEIQKIRGYTTGMGASFRRIARATQDWSGYTATPGDKWIDFMPYFVVTGLIKNKTFFMNRYCRVSTMKGFPEILGYSREDELERGWRIIASIPDTTSVAEQLPPNRHLDIHFNAPADYRKVYKTRMTLEGELIENPMSMCHYLRQLCFTKEKQAWLSDFIEGLGANCIFFCNYKEEEDKVCEIAKKVLPKGARVWRIDGGHKEIPTRETIGKNDIVVAHYASGGEALNLQFMHYWVAVSPNYSNILNTQAEGRIKRIGQDHAMTFYHLKTDKTIEADIYKCLANKKEFSEKTWYAENFTDENK